MQKPLENGQSSSTEHVGEQSFSKRTVGSQLEKCVVTFTENLMSLYRDRVNLFFFQQSTVEHDEIWRVWEISGYQMNGTAWIMHVHIPRRERQEKSSLQL